MQNLKTNAAMDLPDIKEITLNPNETRVPIPLSYVWARIFVRPGSTNPSNQWRFSEKPVNWYHIMTKDENSMEVHSSQHAWDSKVEPHRSVAIIACNKFSTNVIKTISSMVVMRCVIGYLSSSPSPPDEAY